MLLVATTIAQAPQTRGHHPGPRRPPGPTKATQAHTRHLGPRAPPKPEETTQARGSHPGRRLPPTATTQAHGGRPGPRRPRRGHKGHPGPRRPRRPQETTQAQRDHPGPPNKPNRPNNPNNPNKPKLGGESRRPPPWPKERNRVRPRRPLKPTEATQAHGDRPGPSRPPRLKDAAQAYGDRPGPRTRPDAANRSRNVPKVGPNAAATKQSQNPFDVVENEQCPAKAPCVVAGAPIQHTFVAFSAPCKHCTISSKQNPRHLPGARLGGGAFRQPIAPSSFDSKGRRSDSRLPRRRATWRPASSAPAAC